MAKKKSDGEKLIGLLMIGLGAFGLYYLIAGPDRENNATFIPDAIEDRIDRLVETLNIRFGKNWVYLGIAALKLALRRALPKPMVALVDVVYAVEQESKRMPMTSTTKRQLAVTRAIALRLA